MTRFEIFRPESDLFKHEALFSKCFPQSKHLNENYLKWLYLHNPVGTAVGVDCYDGDALVAHYACVPKVFSINGTSVTCLLSLNTATRPEYQGRGLFVKLANQTYTLAKSLGFSFVYGVANANSTPGFISKLGFRLVSPLYTKIGFSRDSALDIGAEVFSTYNSDSLMWRLANPEATYSIRNSQSSTCIVHRPRSFGGFVSVYSCRKYRFEIAANDHSMNFSKLFIGLCNQKCISSLVSIPDFLKPSPLNFIFKGLNIGNVELDFSKLYLDYLDFDAY